MCWGGTPETSARLGCAVASPALERLGGQGYTLGRATLPKRVEGAYGTELALSFARHLENPRP